MYKSVFVDLDGTLTNSKGDVSERTIAVIKKLKSKGIITVITSGRPRSFTMNIAKKCGCDNIIVSTTGGDIYSIKEKKEIFIDKMSNKLVSDLFDIATKNDARIKIYSGFDVFVNKLKRFDGTEILIKNNLKSLLKDKIVSQCVIVDANYEKIKKIYKIVNEIKGVFIINQSKCLVDNSFNPKDFDHYFFDVTTNKCNKGSAIKKVCSELNISTKEVVAFGDDVNDVAMFKVAGLSYAMANSAKVAKDTAKELTFSNDENGVAFALEKLFQIKNAKK